MIRLSAILFAATVGLSGCAYQTDPNYYDPYSVGQIAYTQMGTVRSARAVEIQNDSPFGTGVGTALGGFAGSIAGSFIGPDSYNHHGHKHYYTSDSSVLGSLGGFLGGALVGTLLEQGLSRQTATEYLVQLDNGQMISIVQGAAPIYPGQRVFLQTPNSGRARIVPAA